MARTPDVLAAIGDSKGSSFLVGFAAETENHEANAREKLKRKHLDAIAVNDVSENRAWGAQRNALTLLWNDGKRDLGEASKPVLAARLLDAIEELMHRAADH
jgi:phosphopantothenoylcysteine decarboxylase/phosphopantothenate--cysteine ligase